MGSISVDGLMQMANPFGAFAYAREGAFFKREQEADLQRYIDHLKEKGIILNDNGNRNPPRTITFDNSVENFEVLGEILRQGARLNVPEAALLQEYERRVKGKLPMLSDAEFQEWKKRVGPLAVVTMSTVRFSSNKYTSLQQGIQHPFQKKLSPEAVEAARRQFMVSLRGFLYGSSIGIMGVLSLGTLVCWYHNIQTTDDLKPLLRNWASPIGHSFRETIEPFKTWAHEITSHLKTSSKTADKVAPRLYETEFSKALKRKFTNSR